MEWFKWSFSESKYPFKALCSFGQPIKLEDGECAFLECATKPSPRKLVDGNTELKSLHSSWNLGISVVAKQLAMFPMMPLLILGCYFYLMDQDRWSDSIQRINASGSLLAGGILWSTIELCPRSYIFALLINEDVASLPGESHSFFTSTLDILWVLPLIFVIWGSWEDMGWWTVYAVSSGRMQYSWVCQQTRLINQINLKGMMEGRGRDLSSKAVWWVEIHTS